MPKSQVKAEKQSWQSYITGGTFKGVNINSNGSEPSIRNVPFPTGHPDACSPKTGRNTLRKAEDDLTRKMFKMLLRALNNQIMLPFYVSEFEEQRGKGIPILTSGAFRGLEGQPTRLTIQGGPAVVTDLDDIPVLWYFPRFIGSGLQTNLMNAIVDLAQVYQPPPDSQIQDRRAATQESEQAMLSEPSIRYMTRDQTARAAESTVEKPQPIQQSAEGPVEDTTGLLEHSPITIDQLPLATFKKDITKFCSGDQPLNCPTNGTEDLQRDGDRVQDGLAAYAPFAYYFSPGWAQTGMHYIRPIQMSMHFRNALIHAPEETIRFLEAKRLFDQQITGLTEIIQPSLSSCLRELRDLMLDVHGPTGTALVNGWTSAFPCFAVAVNRTSGLHRDTKGTRAGLDVIGVLGTFNEGGDLELPDLNLRVEWTPGCLGAFDGYDFRHKVHNWTGGSRVALISFLQQATRASLGLKQPLTRPNINECRTELFHARKRRDAVTQGGKDSKQDGQCRAWGRGLGAQNIQGQVKQEQCEG